MLNKLWQTLKGEPYAYQSPDEIFLKKFDEKHPQCSPSQRQEISKAAVIAEGRDKENLAKHSQLWKNF